MSFIGNAPAAIPTSFQAVQADSFNGNGSTTNFTLSRQITNLYDIEVLVDNVQQSPYDGSYSVNGTTITFSSAPGSGTNNIYIVYRDHPITSIQPKGDLTLEANLNVDGTVYANATLARDGGSDATINGVTPTSDNLMGRNRIINGDMRIDQRNAGASTNNAGGSTTYALDRWAYYGTSASKFSIQQSTAAPAGFANSLLITSLAATTTGSGDEYWLIQPIEGFNTADLNWGTANAKTIVVSFWVRSSLTGSFGGSIINGAYNYSFPFAYTIDAANTWEYKTVLITAPTSGTWVGATNGAGLRCVFSLSAGTTYGQGTVNTWQSGTYKVSPAGVTNILETNGATWQMTGVQLEAGSVATSFERRSYGQELALCQRYFETSVATQYQFISGTYNPPTLESYHTWYFKVEKRAAPTFSFLTGSWAVAPTSTAASTTNILFIRSNSYFYGGSGTAAASSEL